VVVINHDLWSLSWPLLGFGWVAPASVLVRPVAGRDVIEVQVLLDAVAREHLPDGADVAVVGRDEALARAGFGGAGFADPGLAGQTVVEGQPKGGDCQVEKYNPHQMA
jgi:hypothetical protein